MILLCGIPSESPLSMVAEALRQIGARPVLFNQREFAQTRIEFTLAGGKATGWLEMGNAAYRLEDFQGVYVRLMDDRFLPELKDEPQDSVLRAYARSLHESLCLWIELSEARVVNRHSVMASNSSKPYQAQIIRRYGLEVPETLVTSDPDAVLAFQRQHGRVIFKSISGVRSIVHTLDDKDHERLNLIRWCPTQFQEFIEGEDVRVHLVGSRVFATRIRSNAVDYRYAKQQVGEPAELEAFELPAAVAERCVALARGLKLPFAGIDLKFRPDGRVYCFEVNPSPGFSYYEANTGQPISTAVAEYLTGRSA
jgi:predicted ATP-grasp superfamily ATP-dependent carboligase